MIDFFRIVDLFQRAKTTFVAEIGLVDFVGLSKHDFDYWIDS